ncbi:MAG: hypothetical protein ILA11_00090, partial [Butyrivibrio sp.]|nr:hypothetical protein [Butyrivibrio sp.]
MKKRIISLIMTGVLGASLITGCGNASTSTPAATTEQNTNTEAAPAATETAPAAAETELGEVSISFYTTETGKDDMYQDLIADFESKNPGITVEYIAAGDDQ